MPNLQPIYEILPPAYRRALALSGGNALEELRLRAGHAPTVVMCGKEENLPLPGGSGLVTQADLERHSSRPTRQMRRSRRAL